MHGRYIAVGFYLGVDVKRGSTVCAVESHSARESLSNSRGASSSPKQTKDIKAPIIIHF